MSETPEGGASKTYLRTPTSWDALDDILLMHLKDNQKLGWKEIALHFTNRTPNACQFRWRRLKSGNLKNPPKSAAVPGVSPSDSNSVSTSRRPSGSGDPGRKNAGPLSTGGPAGSHGTLGGGSTESSKRRSSEFSGVYSSLANSTFTGYDTVSSAVAGLNALGSGGPGHSGGPLGPINTTSHPQNFDHSPKMDVPLDPQTHSAAAGTSGGYFTEISVDPTLNLPHNKPHQVPHSLGTTPRNLTVDQHSVNLMHNNSVIQIIRDDRYSVSSQQRLSVLSLPSKSMDIPHHQTNSSSLAHLPLLYGGNSISGPAGGSLLSVSGPSGLPQLSLTLSSIRNGLIVGPLQAYLRRLSVMQKDRDKAEDEGGVKPKDDNDAGKADKPEPTKDGARTMLFSEKHKPIFKIPWSMEEDELLINRRRKELSFAELSILLPQRTEGEIWGRIDALERLKNGHRALVSRGSQHRSQSSLGLDEDDFYDEVDSVIGGMDSDEDDESGVLLDVDEAVSSLRGTRKRRASSAVNPLAREGIRARLS